MLVFYGSDLELVIDRVLSWRDGPVLCSAWDGSGRQWIILQVDDSPSHLVWVCAPASGRAIEAITTKPEVAWDAVCHSATGTAEVVVVDHGRAVPDRCVLGSSLSHALPTESIRLQAA
jgi:hypothetical protein